MNLTCIWNMSMCCSEIIKFVTFFLFVPNVPFLYPLKTSEKMGWEGDKSGPFKTKPMFISLKLMRLSPRCNLREAPGESGRVGKRVNFESKNSRFGSHWFARPGFGSQTCYKALDDLRVILVEQLLLVTGVVNGAFWTSLTHSNLPDEPFLFCYCVHVIFVVDVFNCYYLHNNFT